MSKEKQSLLDSRACMHAYAEPAKRRAGPTAKEKLLEHE